MDKLKEMENQLRQYVGCRDEEGRAKFLEALEYVSKHITPEVRERMTLFVEEGYEQSVTADMLSAVAEYQGL